MKKRYLAVLFLVMVMAAGCKKSEPTVEQKEEKPMAENVTEEAADAVTKTATEDPDSSSPASKAVQITDISQVIEMNLKAADAAKELGLNYEYVSEDDAHYFYTDKECDGNQGVLWCDDYQCDEENNWTYAPGETNVTVYGVKRGMTREEVSSLLSDQIWEDVTDYFGIADAGDFYYRHGENDFIVNGLIYEGCVENVNVFSGKDY